jgi:hypothetical protein
MTATDDLAADALDRQIKQALADGYLDDAMELASDSLTLRIAAVEDQASRFPHLSDTLDLVALIVHESGLPEPANLGRAAECYYAATFSILSPEKHFSHAETIVEVAEKLALMRRLNESFAACKAAEPIFEENASEQPAASLQGLVRTVSVRCVVLHLRGEKDSLMRLAQKRSDLITQCIRLGIDPPKDILVQLRGNP